MYVEPSEPRENEVGSCFQELRTGTGDLALWWEVARGRRLGRRNCNCDVAARKTRAKPGHASFQSWETSSIPGTCVPRAAADSPIEQADIQLVYGAVTAQPAEIRLARPTRNPPSHRRA